LALWYFNVEEGFIFHPLAHNSILSFLMPAKPQPLSVYEIPAISIPVEKANHQKEK